jgi:hypothetical protein
MNNGAYVIEWQNYGARVISSTNVHEANKNEFLGMPFLSFFQMASKKYRI